MGSMKFGRVPCQIDSGTQLTAIVILLATSVPLKSFYLLRNVQTLIAELAISQ